MRTTKGTLCFGYTLTKKLFQKNLKNPLDKLHKVWYNVNVIKGRNQ